jgi:hypothetical protein
MELASDLEQALDPELAPEEPGSSDHLREIKVPDLDPEVTLGPG